MSYLPEGWTQARLGEVAAPTRPRVKPAEFPALPFVGMEHIEAHTMRLLGTRPAVEMKSSAVHFQPDDVLYGRLRPYLNKVYRPEFEGLCSAEFIVLPPSERIVSGFLQYVLNSSAFVAFASRLNTGDRPRVDFDQIAEYAVPVPPINEQRAIVKEIEKQFTRLDAADSSVEHAGTRIVRFRAAVLESAATGTLVGASRDSWETSTIGELATEVRYGTSTRTAETGDVPVLRMGNVVNGSLQLEKLKYLPAGHTEFPSLLLQSADILFNRTNSPELVGKAAVFAGELDPCSFASYLIRVRLRPELNPRFLSYVLNSPSGRAWARSVVSQQVGQANINGSKLKAMRVHVPPLGTQEAIVTRAESLLSWGDELARHRYVNQAKSKSIREAILARALSGKSLVDDPDE